MMKKEDIESWNEIFPDCEIKEKDLTNITKVFLIKALAKYLQKFGFEVHPPTQSSEFDLVSRDNRLYFIKIVQHIDHILKITDKSYSFTYFDLIHPSTKKTSNMLGILLNYLYYFNMYKTEVFAKSSEAIKAHNELLVRLQQAEEENQQRKIKAQKIKEDIVVYSVQLPKARAQMASLGEQKLEQQEETKKLEFQLKDIKEKLADLQMQKRNLKKKIVPDTEAQELQLQLKKQQDKITELNALTAPAENAIKELAQSVKSMQNLLKDIEETKDMLPMGQLEALQDIEKTCLDTKNAVTVNQKNKTGYLEQMQLSQDEIKLVKENLKVQQKEFEEEKSSTKKYHDELKMAFQEKNNPLEHLRHEAEHLDVLREEQEEIKIYLKENIYKLMRRIEK